MAYQLRLLQPGFLNYTGLLGGINWVDGATTAPVSANLERSVAASFLIERFNGASGQAGSAADIVAAGVAKAAETPDGSTVSERTEEERVGLLVKAQVKTIADTEYTLTADDNGYVLDFTAATAVTVEVPAGLGDGFYCGISQGGVGQVTLEAADDVTINEADDHFSTEKRYVLLSLAAFEPDEYRLYGRTAAAA